MGIEPARENPNVIRVPLKPGKQQPGTLSFSIPKDCFQPSCGGAEAFQERVAQYSQEGVEEREPPRTGTAPPEGANVRGAAKREDTSPSGAPPAERAPVVLQEDR